MFISLGCFVLFTACNTTQNLLSKVLDDDGFGKLGYYSLALFYFFFGVTSLLAGPTIKAIGNRWALTVGALTYTIYTAIQIMPVEKSEHGVFKNDYNLIYVLICVAASINGWGASLTWNA